MLGLSARGLFFIGFTVVFTVAGQLLVKRGMLVVGTAPNMPSHLPAFLIHVLLNPLVIFGLGSAVLAALCWTVAVSQTPLSIAYPFMSLSLVLVLALSGLLFADHMTFRQWVGVLIVCVGVFISAKG